MLRDEATAPLPIHSVNESLLLVWVSFTVPSCGTLHEAPSATNSPGGEEGDSQSPAAPTG